MHQYHVNITPPSEFQRLAGTDRGDMYADVEFLFKHRPYDVEQAGIIRFMRNISGKSQSGAPDEQINPY